MFYNGPYPMTLPWAASGFPLWGEKAPISRVGACSLPGEGACFGAEKRELPSGEVWAAKRRGACS
jgi:hypothetical protein